MGEKAIRIKEEQVKPLLENKFVSVYDLQYEEGRHYYDASRRKKEDLSAIKSEEEFNAQLPDAVSAFLILKTKGEEDRLLLTYEYRYPIGQYLMSVPAGLIDEEDKKAEDPLIYAMTREIYEETGIRLKESDRIYTVNPLMFCTPGFTDECTAAVCAVAELEDLSSLSQEGAEGSEKFDGFLLLNREEAKKILLAGRDPHGHFYPMITWAAISYFLSGLWEEE